jgi:hypothetical protein
MSRQTLSRETNRQPQSQQKENRLSTDSNSEKQITGEDFYDMVTDVSKSMSDYCAKRPKAAALALIAVGFFLGWKIKPW